MFSTVIPTWESTKLAADIKKHYYKIIILYLTDKVENLLGWRLQSKIDWVHAFTAEIGRILKGS